MGFIFRGIIERQIGDKSFMFKYNMAALTYFGDLQNCSLVQLGEELKNPKMSTIANFIYAGYYTYCRQEKKPIIYTQDDACEWVNEMGIDKALELFNDAFDTPESVKNSEAPKEQGPN